MAIEAVCAGLVYISFLGLLLKRQFLQVPSEGVAAVGGQILSHENLAWIVRSWWSLYKKCLESTVVTNSQAIGVYLTQAMTFPKHFTVAMPIQPDQDQSDGVSNKLSRLNVGKFLTSTKP